MTDRLAKLILFSLAFPLIYIIFPAQAATGAEADFPLYPAIAGNVRFWEKVYSEYSLDQVVVHDRNDLNIVYTVLDLGPSVNPGNLPDNRGRIDRVRGRYRQILLDLARNLKPSSLEEARVLHLFGPEPTRQTLEEAAENIRVQRGQKERFREGIVRSGAYLAAIREIFQEYGLPEGLIYLAHVESSFNHLARSRAGAVGLWQFIPGTGRRYLTIDGVVDERRDPLKATRAAAELLRDNYLELGNWPLAITAYNYGRNGMKRAVSDKGCFEDIICEYEGKYFGFAAKNFYAEFLAAKRVAANYRDYFGELAFASPALLHRIPLEGFVDARRLAGYLNIDVAAIGSLNPDLDRAVMRGEKLIPAGYNLRLPVNFAGQFEVAGQLPASIYRPGQKKTAFHQVRTGETPYEIARRYGVKIDELLYANRIPENGVIFAGQNLRIPPPLEAPFILAGVSKLATQAEGGVNKKGV